MTEHGHRARTLEVDPSSAPNARHTQRTRRTIWSTGATALAALVAALTVDGGAARSGEIFAAAGGNTVATVELAAPTVGSFVLQATIPVPKKTFPRSDGLVPFSIRDSNGQIVPTQVELVTRYPNGSDGADVVEVIGRVQRPTGAQPGVQVQYDIVDDPHAKKKFAVNKDVLKLLSKPSSVIVVAYDCFGHKYVLDLVKDSRLAYMDGYSKQLRDGVAASQWRTYGVMMPQTSNIGQPSGALPHFFGVHAYFTTWSKSDAFSLDLRVSAGTSGLDASSKVDDPMGDIYFKSFELWVRKGWTVENALKDTAQGASYDAGTWTAFPLVAKRSDGKLHLMPSQGQFERRLALTKTGNEAEARAYARSENVAFAVDGISKTSGQELFSWWNPQTARYFPQRHRLPELDHIGSTAMRQKLGVENSKIENLIANGTPAAFPFPTMGAMGWAYPYGAKYGGMTSGQEIFMFDGLTTAASASNQGYRMYQALSRMYVERQPTTLFNKDGEPTRVSQWVVSGSGGKYVPMYFFLKLLSGNDPFGLKTAPLYQVNYVAQNNLEPPYEIDLRAYGAIDFQHYVRLTRSQKVLVWLGNDALAKDDLKMAAELFRLSYHDLPNDPKGSAIGSGMLADINSVNNKPGIGFAFGRGEGWGIDCMSAVYSFADPAWRTEALPWYQKIADLVIAGQNSCTGLVQNQFNNKWLNGQYRARQSFEGCIVENALWGARESVLLGVDVARTNQVEDFIEQAVYGLIGPLGWDASMKAPLTVTAVAPLNGPIYCTALPNNGDSGKADLYYTWCSLAYAYQLTGDSAFITAGDQMIKGDLLTVMTAQGYNTLENRAALLALVQQGVP